MHGQSQGRKQHVKGQQQHFPNSIPQMQSSCDFSSLAAQCLKITEKVSFQHCERSELRLHFEWTKVHQNCLKCSIWQFKKLNWRSNSVTRQVTFKRTKNGEKCQLSKIQMRHFQSFSNNVYLTLFSFFTQFQIFFPFI